MLFISIRKPDISVLFYRNECADKWRCISTFYIFSENLTLSS